MARIAAVIVALLATLFLAAPTAYAAPANELQYSVDQFAIENGLKPANWAYVPSGTIADTECGPLSSAESLVFCPADATAYIGDDGIAWINQFHPLGHAFAKAHEWGHSLQFGVDPNQYDQRHEDGADCVAGAWMAWADKQGHIDVGLADLPGLIDLMNGLKRQYEGDVHGTFFDRSSATVGGFTFGLDYCGFRYIPIR